MGWSLPEGAVFATPALAGLPILLGALSPLGFDVLIVGLKFPSV